MNNKIIITCEHASNIIPKEWQHLFNSDFAQKDLATHLGIDLGAKDAASYFTKHFKCPYFFGDYSRLLIELNRTLNNKNLFSKYSQNLNIHDKEEIIHKYYTPYRHNVENLFRQLIDSGHRVIHFSIHSFTPVLNNIERETDIGLLYDPKRKDEKRLCTLIKQDYIRSFNNYKIRLNYPYKGTSDGFTTYLRKVFSINHYIGIEIELNQKYIKQDQFPKILLENFCSSIEKSLNALK